MPILPPASNEIKPLAPVPNPAPAPPTPEPTPAPSYSVWQLLWMLVKSLWASLLGVGKAIKGQANKGVHTSFLLLVLTSIIGGCVGGKVSQVEGPMLSGFWEWVFHWHLPHPGPGPTPTPTPAPIPAKGLHVLVVGDEAKMTPAQIYALKSTEVRTYLNSTCAKGPDGKQPEYRIWPSTVDTANESQLWKDAFTRTSGKTLPWIIISNPDHGGGYEGPLPTDQASLLTLLKKYGG